MKDKIQKSRSLAATGTLILCLSLILSACTFSGTDQKGSLTGSDRVSIATTIPTENPAAEASENLTEKASKNPGEASKSGETAAASERGETEKADASHTADKENADAAPASSDNSGTLKENADPIADMIVDGKRLGDMTQEEKEAHPPVPAVFYVDGKEQEVMPPEAIKNLADQEIYLRNIRERTMKSDVVLMLDENLGLQAAKEIPKENEGENSSSVSADSRPGSDKEKSVNLDREAVVIFSDPESSALPFIFLSEKDLASFEKLLDRALSGISPLEDSPLKRRKKDVPFDSQILLPGSGHFYFVQEDYAEKARSKSVLVQKDGVIYELPPETCFQEDFRSFLGNMLEAQIERFYGDGEDPRDSDLPSMPKLSKTRFLELPTSEIARVLVKNIQDADLTTDCTYMLARFDGRAFQKPDPAAVLKMTAVPTVIRPNGERELSFHLREDYGELERGFYVLRMKLHLKNTQQSEVVSLYFALDPAADASGIEDK